MDDLYLLGYGADNDPLPEFAQESWREGWDEKILWDSIRFLARELHDLREESKIGSSDTPHVPYLDN